jgi:hypothetical protein
MGGLMAETRTSCAPHHEAEGVAYGLKCSPQKQLLSKRAENDF